MAAQQKLPLLGKTAPGQMRQHAWLMPVHFQHPWHHLNGLHRCHILRLRLGQNRYPKVLIGLAAQTRERDGKGSGATVGGNEDINSGHGGG